MEQSEHIKQLEKKIEELTNNIKKITEKVTVSLREIIALQIAKFAITNKVTRPQTNPVTPVSLSTKLLKSPQLIIDFIRCSIPIVENLVSNLQNHLQAYLTGYQRTKAIKIKGINCDAKNSQQVFMFFYFNIDEIKTRIYKEEWLKAKYPLAKIQLSAIYLIKINKAKICTVVD